MLAHTEGAGSDGAVAYPKIPFDLDAYEQRVRTDSADGRCFICSIVAGERDDHLVLYRDDVCMLTAAVPTERLYVLSIGSYQGNAHVHWHLAPLPPGVPYREQQYAALMHEHGHLDIPEEDLVALARDIARRVDRV